MPVVNQLRRESQIVFLSQLTRRTFVIRVPWLVPAGNITKRSISRVNEFYVKSVQTSF